MTLVRCTLVTDGASDRVLLRVLDWLLRVHCTRPFVQQWADLRNLPTPPRTLTDRVRVALELHECELLFVHRDAEGMSPSTRKGEILEAVAPVVPRQVTVCVIPVRMQEAWFLLDAAAIRLAADNPNGTVDLALPPPARIEELRDPKRLLHRTLEKASELPPRRLRGFAVHRRVHRLAEVVSDYSPLRLLPAFQALEQDLRACLQRHGWAGP